MLFATDKTNPIKQTIETQLDSNALYQTSGKADALFPLRIKIEPNDHGTYTITSTLDLSRARSEHYKGAKNQFEENIKELFRLRCGSQEARLQKLDTDDDNRKIYRARLENIPYTDLVSITNTETGIGNGISCTVNGKRVMQLIGRNGTQEAPMAFPHASLVNEFALTISEIRQLTHPLSPEVLAKIPYPRKNLRNFNRETHAPITDIHTHLSAQLAPEDLFAAAEANDKPERHIGYPLDLLEEMGIDIDVLDDWMSEKGYGEEFAHGFAFNPANDEGYAKESEKKTDDITKPGTHPGVYLKTLSHFFSENPAQKAIFMDAMAIKPDEIMGAADMDKYFYRFRNPLEKNPILTRDKIMQVAKAYKQQGVKYAELSTGSMFNPQWLAEVLPALEEAEQKTGVQLRLMVGLPRTASRPQLKAMVEKMRVLAQSPYIVGADLLGFELNKTDEFEWVFDEIHKWAKESDVKAEGDNPPVKTDFTIRVHAGENSKNRDNVRRAIEKAKDMGISLRVGHAIYGDLDTELFELARETGTIIEFIPDSNIALDSVDFLSDIPLKEWVRNGVRWVLGSDGAGSYLTTNDQLAKSALHAGLSTKELGEMICFEEELVAAQQKMFAARKAIFDAAPNTHSPASHNGDINAFVKAYSDHAKLVDEQLKKDFVPHPDVKAKDTLDNPPLPERFTNKTPVLIAGASGSSWKNISAEYQKDAQIAAEMLVQLLDPEKVYFVTGRTKFMGFEQCFVNANERLERRGKFDVISTVSKQDAERTEGGTSSAPAAWNMDLHGGRVKLAGHVADFMEQHKGGDGKPAAYSIFCGGSSLTRMFIREMRDRNLPHGLMQGPEGATNDKSRTGFDHQVIPSKELAIETVLHVAKQMGEDVFKGGRVPSEFELVQLRDEITKRVEKNPMSVPQHQQQAQGRAR